MSTPGLQTSFPLQLGASRIRTSQANRSLVRSGLRRATWRLLEPARQMAKRTLDIFGSATLLLALSPVFLLLATLVKLDSRGPVFFRQTRVGRWGRHFTLLKFRSMHIDAEERKQALAEQVMGEGELRFKMKNDPRITRVGRLLRKTSMDELPQLWNILIGDMSLVGPRPPIQPEVDQYSLPERQRLDVTPGLTCIWQVSGRSDIPFDRQVELDVTYIHEQSLWLDLVLLFKTVPAVVLGRGAY